MFRRLLAAFLVIAIVAPIPALAIGGCPMDVPMLAAERCECCTSPGTTGACAGQIACGCMLRADGGTQSAPATSSNAPTVTFAIETARLSASLSTPQRASRNIELAASPPGAGSIVSRPLLCTWTI